MITVTKKIVEKAALVCAIAASTWKDDRAFRYYDGIASDLWCAICEPDWRRVKDLAMAAWSAAMKWHALGELEGGWPRSVDAEAEALLRTGWLPAGWRIA